MNTWELCPKCKGEKILVVNVYGACDCNVCNGSGIISCFTGKPPEWSYKTTYTSDTTEINQQLVADKPKEVKP